MLPVYPARISARPVGSLGPNFTQVPEALKESRYARLGPLQMPGSPAPVSATAANRKPG
jgi:hypothetical protein